MGTDNPSVEQHFQGKDPKVRALYDLLLATVRAFGEVVEDPKKTSIHLNRRTAFAGVATRKEAIVLTVKASRDIASPRVIKREQASAHRWHLEVRLTDPAQVDYQIATWLGRAIELSE
jgi:hypothetical protein